MSEILTQADPRFTELFDINDPRSRRGLDIIEDPYLLLAGHRARAPVHAQDARRLVGQTLVPGEFIRERPHFTALSFTTCNEILVENRVYSSEAYDEYFKAKQVGRSILNMMGDEHRRYRGVVQPLFLRQMAVSWWSENWIEEIVDELIASFAGERVVDLNQALCARLPLYTVTRAFGLNDDQAVDFRYYFTRHMSLDVTPAERAEGNLQVQAILSAAIAEKRERPADDIISRLLVAEFKDDDGSVHRLSEEEILGFCRILIIAGGDTTWRQMGITLVALLNNPDQLQQVRENRALAANAIHEALRWNPATPIVYRLTTEDVNLAGVDIPAGAIVHACVGAGNRDPELWDNPDTFDLNRPMKRHLGFGGGPHTCLGMFVAQAEINVAINRLLDRTPNIRLDPDLAPPVITGTLEMRAVSHLQVRLD